MDTLLPHSLGLFEKGIHFIGKGLSLMDINLLGPEAAKIGTKTFCPWLQDTLCRAVYSGF
jgi:hypothetical protein